MVSPDSRANLARRQAETPLIAPFRLAGPALIDEEAVVACNGVTACDHAKSAATAIPSPMVPVEKKSLRMTASLRVRWVL
jgi:hypothetical protein